MWGSHWGPHWPYMLRELSQKSCAEEENNNQACGFAVQTPVAVSPSLDHFWLLS